MCSVLSGNGGDQAPSVSGVVATVLFSVFDGEDDGTSGTGLVLNGTGGTSLLIGCRFTHNDAAGTYGVSVSNHICYMEHCAFYDNDTDYTGTIVVGDGNDTTLTADGYVNRSSNDFNIGTGEDLRSEAWELIT